MLWQAAALKSNPRRPKITAWSAGFSLELLQFAPDAKLQCLDDKMKAFTVLAS
jgi:hypothetical protein